MGFAFNRRKEDMNVTEVVCKRTAAALFAVGLVVMPAFGDGLIEPSECASDGIDLVAGSSDEDSFAIDTMEGRSWTWLASEGVNLKAFPPVGFLLFLR